MSKTTSPELVLGLLRRELEHALGAMPAAADDNGQLPDNVSMTVRLVANALVAMSGRPLIAGDAVWSKDIIACTLRNASHWIE